MNGKPAALSLISALSAACPYMPNGKIWLGGYFPHNAQRTSGSAFVSRQELVPELRR